MPKSPDELAASGDECADIPSLNTPPDRLLRLPEVMQRVGLKRSAIYKMMRDGRFPHSRSLSPRCAVWIESEIDAWIASIAAAGTNFS
ncbi:helix-turn-helix transcriptional regulator [Sphingobium phenoxybenzoativorans]|uniref:helix-turn-helix transcriptional regulator n=1 Tax=Sphingobium phenoxybenzoativorans TaxID=1592790 RepID=UPI0009F72C23|nr:AlpA family transcriptional regulator [Sphingobium phenoxybenzoativorans]